MQSDCRRTEQACLLFLCWSCGKGANPESCLNLGGWVKRAACSWLLVMETDFARHSFTILFYE